jgi:hypothetical protein
MNNQSLIIVFLQPQADLFIVRPGGAAFRLSSKNGTNKRCNPPKGGSLV